MSSDYHGFAMKQQSTVARYDHEHPTACLSPSKCVPAEEFTVTQYRDVRTGKLITDTETIERLEDEIRESHRDDFDTIKPKLFTVGEYKNGSGELSP